MPVLGLLHFLQAFKDQKEANSPQAVSILFIFFPCTSVALVVESWHVQDCQRGALSASGFQTQVSGRWHGDRTGGKKQKSGVPSTSMRLCIFPSVYVHYFFLARGGKCLCLCNPTTRRGGQAHLPRTGPGKPRCSRASALHVATGQEAGTSLLGGRRSTYGLCRAAASDASHGLRRALPLPRHPGMCVRGRRLARGASCPPASEGSRPPPPPPHVMAGTSREGRDRSLFFLRAVSHLPHSPALLSDGNRAPHQGLPGLWCKRRALRAGGAAGLVLGLFSFLGLFLARDSHLLMVLRASCGKDAFLPSIPPSQAVRSGRRWDTLLPGSPI